MAWLFPKKNPNLCNNLKCQRTFITSIQLTQIPIGSQLLAQKNTHPQLADTFVSADPPSSQIQNTKKNTNGDRRTTKRAAGQTVPRYHVNDMEWKQKK